MTPPKDATAGEALKPCPFCGGTDAGLENNPYLDDNDEPIPGEDCWYVSHRCDGEHTVNICTHTQSPTRENAIAAWNRRPSADPAAVEAARAAALEEAAKVVDWEYRRAVGAREAKALLDAARAIRALLSPLSNGG